MSYDGPGVYDEDDAYDSDGIGSGPDTGTRVRYPMLLEMAFGADPTTDPDTWVWTHVGDEGTFTDQTVQIRRGRQDEASEVTPSSASFELDNRSGDFTPGNTESAYYPNVRRGTPVRFWAQLDGVWHVRFVGQVSEWALDWPYGDLSTENDPGESTVTIVCNGILRRLGQGAQPFESPLFRHLSTLPGVIAYWPMEDGAITDHAESALAGGKPLGFTDGVEWAQDSTLTGSRPLPSLNEDAIWTGRVPPQEREQWSVTQMVRLPRTTDQTTVLRIVTADAIFRLTMSTYELHLESLGRPHEGVVNWTVANIFTTTVPLTGRWLRIGLRRDRTDSFGNTIMIVTVRQVGGELLVEGESLTGLGGTEAKVVISVGGRTAAPPEGMAVGHLCVSTDDSLADPETGWVGELAPDRVARLCAEQNVPVDIIGSTALSEPMGPQPPATFLELLGACTAAELGVLGEQVDRPGLTFRTRATRYNQTPALALDAAADQIANPLTPTLDDQGIRNDLTVTREDGASSRAIDQDSIDADGLYDDEVSLCLASDTQTRHQAAWRLHLGIWPGMRYPSVTSDLDPAPGWADVAMGDRVTAENLPPQHPDDLDLLIEGMTETITSNRWTVQANCSPAGPWDVWKVGDDVGSAPLAL